MVLLIIRIFTNQNTEQIKVGSFAVSGHLYRSQLFTFYNIYIFSFSLLVPWQSCEIGIKDWFFPPWVIVATATS